MSNVYEIMRGVKTVKDFTQSVNMGLHYVFSGKINLKTQRCLPNVCQVIKNTPSRCLESVFLCPGREHFYMLIISVLQNIQAKTQAILERHNVRMVAPNKGSKINGKIGDEPVFFYEPFIGQYVSVVDVVVRIRQESIERPMDCIVFP